MIKQSFSCNVEHNLPIREIAAEIERTWFHEIGTLYNSAGTRWRE